MAVEKDAGAIYDGFGANVTPNAPPWDGVGGMVHARPLCRLLFNSQAHDFDGTVDRIWALPAGPDPRPIPGEMLAEVVATLDAAGAVAIQATHEEAIDQAIGAALAWVGGGHG